MPWPAGALVPVGADGRRAPVPPTTLPSSSTTKTPTRAHVPVDAGGALDRPRARRRPRRRRNAVPTASRLPRGAALGRDHDVADGRGHQIAVKLRLSVSPNTSGAARRTRRPSTIANVLISSRTLRAQQALRSAARNTAVSPTTAAVIRAITSSTLLTVGVAQLVDDPAVGEEDDPVGVRRRHGVVGDHHDRLLVLGRR